jgi:hypothetical protein
MSLLTPSIEENSIDDVLYENIVDPVTKFLYKAHTRQRIEPFKTKYWKNGRCNDNLGKLARVNPVSRFQLVAFLLESFLLK